MSFKVLIQTLQNFKFNITSERERSALADQHQLKTKIKVNFTHLHLSRMTIIEKSILFISTQIENFINK